MQPSSGRERSLQTMDQGGSKSGKTTFLQEARLERTVQLAVLAGRQRGVPVVQGLSSTRDRYTSERVTSSAVASHWRHRSQTGSSGRRHFEARQPELATPPGSSGTGAGGRCRGSISTSLPLPGPADLAQKLSEVFWKDLITPHSCALTCILRMVASPACSHANRLPAISHLLKVG